MKISNEELSWLDEFYATVQAGSPTKMAHELVMLVELEYGECRLNDLALCALGRDNIQKVRRALRRAFKAGNHIVQPEFFEPVMRLLSHEHVDGISDRLAAACPSW